MTIQEVGSGDTRKRPIKLGGALITLVEPHEGHQVAYNRWYERDHFYAGVMTLPGSLSGQRWVATPSLKAQRRPAGSPIVPRARTSMTIGRSEHSERAAWHILRARFGVMLSRAASSTARMSLIRTSRDWHQPDG